MRPERLRTQLKDAYRRLLNPLVRILIRNGVTVTETTNLVRRVYLDAATTKEFQLPGQRNSDTRTAILTGLTRKEIQRLKNDSDEVDTGTNLDQIALLIASWNQDPDFTGPYGLPLAIPFESPRGHNSPSFTELVRRHGDEASAKDFLDEVIRLGLASIDDDGLIRNSGRTYIPSKLEPAAIDRLGRVVGRLADTLDYNNQVSEASLGRFERAVITDIGLSEEQYQRFNYFLREQCQRLLETIDNWLAKQEGRLDAYKSPEILEGKKIMTGIGIYHFLDEQDSGESTEFDEGSSEEKGT